MQQVRDKFDQWRICWKDYLLGKEWDENKVEAKEVIASLERIADAGTPIESKEDTSEVVFSSPFFTLHAITMAYCTPGTKYYHQDNVRNEIFAEMKTLCEDGYNLLTPPENWWALEIGIPLRLLNILILMYEELPNREQTIEQLTDVILHFQNAYEITSRGQKEGAANLMWKCHVHMLVGILRKEMQWIDWANKHLQEILQYTGIKQVLRSAEPIYDDGFHPDGSFIQHHFFAYTGAYGKSLLSILAGLMYAFHDEECLQLDQEKEQFVFDVVHKAYEPLIYQGNFMDIVRGRDLSRHYQEDNIAGRHCIRSICYLANIMTGENQKRTRAMLKEWLRNNGTREILFKDEHARAEYFIQPSLVEVVEEIERDTVSPRGELVGNYQFGPMCKTVHLSKGFGMALSMYSKTLACYEYLNGESNKCWHVNDGVTYLYTADANQYNGDFYASVDMQRLPGITVDRSLERYTDPYYCWYLPESKNVYAFAGGATLGDFGITGLQYRGQGNGKERDLEVKKSWFMFDDAVVCLGSGITSTTGNEIETIIDNKKLKKNMSNEITMMDMSTKKCDSLTGEETVHKTSFLHLTGNAGAASDIGYYFPEDVQIKLLCEQREGTWNDAKVNPNNKRTNNYATYWIAHGKYPKDATYKYVILPGKSVAEMEVYEEKQEISICECSNQAHAVFHNRLDILGIHFWNKESYTCQGITCDTQASVMVKRENQLMQIAVADPTKTDVMINIAFDFSITNVEKIPEQVEVINYSPFTIRVNTKNLHGESLVLSNCNLS
ncbi:MAG: polysaccharide lyase 8 family protein [Suipraeoptans sp.]